MRTYSVHRTNTMIPVSAGIISLFAFSENGITVSSSELIIWIILPVTAAFLTFIMSWRLRSKEKGSICYWYRVIHYKPVIMNRFNRDYRRAAVVPSLEPFKLAVIAALFMSLCPASLLFTAPIICIQLMRCIQAMYELKMLERFMDLDQELISHYRRLGITEKDKNIVPGLFSSCY